MAERRRLADRRSSEPFDFVLSGFRFSATVSRFRDGRFAEIFLSDDKLGSDADAGARDSAFMTSLALQYGVPTEELRKAVLRGARGRTSGPLGMTLDMLAIC